MPQVLVTRPEPDASLFAQACKQGGLTPVLCPVITIEFKPDAPALGEVSGLAFTSANGVRAFTRHYPDRAIPVYAVGEITAKAARDAGFANVQVADGDVESLLGMTAANFNSGAQGVLHITGAHRAGDLVAGLKNRGIPARRIVLYEQKDAEHLPPCAVKTLKDCQGSVYVTFFSPRTARVFLALVKKAGLAERLSYVSAVCLSGAVAQAVSGAGFKTVETAKTRNSTGMIASMSAGKQ